MKIVIDKGRIEIAEKLLRLDLYMEIISDAISLKPEEIKIL
ncbi:MAG: hypothetical protein ABRQ38_03045 [Candidatus Eremiobacterota bacterium]